MTDKFRTWRNINSFSYVGLIIVITVWHFVIAPPKHTYSIILSVGYVLLLLTPAFGLIKKSYRVYMWSSYIMLIYFMHGIIETWANADEKIYAILELVLSIAFYISATVCARHAKQLEENKEQQTG